MSMRVNRAEFLATLRMVEPGLSSRDFLAQSSCFVFMGGWVCTFNEEVACRAKSGIDKSYTGAVRAQQLLAVLEAMPDDDLLIEPGENELRIIGVRKSAGIRMESEILLPIEDVECPERDDWKSLPEDFSIAIEQIAAVAGVNRDEFLLTCINITPDWIEATDRWQAMRYRIKTGISRRFLVRAKSISPLAKLAMNKIGETENWIHLRNNAIIYSIRRHLDEYPNMSHLFEFDGTPCALPKGANEAAELASIFSGDDPEQNRATVRLSNGHMVVRGEGQFGWASADLDMSDSEWPATFRIDPMLLQKIIKQFDMCEIKNNEHGPSKLRVVGERWTYMTALSSGDPKPDVDDTPPSGDDHGD